MTRHVNEQIVIGDDIVITIVEARRRGRVKIGVSAPKGVSIHRSEIYERIKREGPQLDPPRETI